MTRIENGIGSKGRQSRRGTGDIGSGACEGVAEASGPGTRAGRIRGHGQIVVIPGPSQPAQLIRLARADDLIRGHGGRRGSDALSGAKLPEDHGNIRSLKRGEVGSDLLVVNDVVDGIVGDDIAAATIRAGEGSGEGYRPGAGDSTHVVVGGRTGAVDCDAVHARDE